MLKTKKYGEVLIFVEDYLRRSNIGVFNFRKKCIKALFNLDMIKEKIPVLFLRKIKGVYDFFH